MNNKTITQKDRVLEYVKLNQPVRTEQIKIDLMKEGISAPDSHLRVLQQQGLLTSYYDSHFNKMIKKYVTDRTKTWVEKSNYSTGLALHQKLRVPEFDYE
jgi:hypothetical protein